MPGVHQGAYQQVCFSGYLKDLPLCSWEKNFGTHKMGGYVGHTTCVKV